MSIDRICVLVNPFESMGSQEYRPKSQSVARQASDADKLVSKALRCVKYCEYGNLLLHKFPVYTPSQIEMVLQKLMASDKEEEHISRDDLALLTSCLMQRCYMKSKDKENNSRFYFNLQDYHFIGFSELIGVSGKPRIEVTVDGNMSWAANVCKNVDLTVDGDLKGLCVGAYDSTFRINGDIMLPFVKDSEGCSFYVRKGTRVRLMKGTQEGQNTVYEMDRRGKIVKEWKL